MEIKRQEEKIMQSKEILEKIQKQKLVLREDKFNGENSGNTG